MECLRCNHQLTIAHNINWINCEIYYYPVCAHCGWTTKQVFDSADAITEWYKIIKEE